MCQHMTVLVDLACERCINKFGPKCGHIANKIRTNPSFAKYVYNLVKAEYGPILTPTFEEFFGSLSVVKIVQ